MKIRLLAIVFAALVLLAGCSAAPTAPASGPTAPTPPPGGSTPPSAAGSATPSGTPTATPSATASSREVNAQGHAVTGWVTPTGNISCALLSDGSSDTAVRCDIDHAAWKGPKKPASCQFNWGTSVELHAGKPGFACVSDPVVYAAQVGENGAWWYHSGGPTVSSNGEQFAVLAYGDTIRLGTISCVSARSALTCTDSHTKHGFHYSEQAYDFF